MNHELVEPKQTDSITDGFYLVGLHESLHTGILRCKKSIENGIMEPLLVRDNQWKRLYYIGANLDLMKTNENVCIPPGRI